MKQEGSDPSAAFHALLEAQFEEKVSTDPFHRSRVKAWEHYLQLGLPTHKTEMYRYVKLRHLFTPRYGFPVKNSLSADDIQAHIYPECYDSVLVFYNGLYQPSLSRVGGLPEKLVISPLNEASKTYGAFLNNQWMQSLKDERDPFATLNAALYEGSIFLYLPPNCLVESPLQILHLVQHVDESSALMMPRVHLAAGVQSELNMVLSTVVLDQSHYGINQVTEMTLEEGAHVTVTQVATADKAKGWHLDALRATLKRNSTLKTVHVTEGSDATRYDYRVSLVGENAEASLNGVSMLKEKRESHANILIEHQAPHCRSNQLFKNALEDVSRSSFEGKILVRQLAQKTEAFQLNQNLLLSDVAHADSKPNLEIFADDVKASHGATVGQLNPEEIFYLTTKGIPKELAKTLLVYGFCKQVLDLIPLASLQKQLCLRVQQYLLRS